MKKQTLINKLIEARNVEEGATATYYAHLDALSSRFISDEEFAKKAKQVFQLLIDGNKKHEAMCKEMLKLLENEDKNDY